MPTLPPLAPIEARIIGALIEKEITTPEQYPLSLNALVNACNQKNNRDPVLSLSEADVVAALEGLTARPLIATDSERGDRVVKYRQRFCNTTFGSLQFDAQELAIVCELLLRGAQMPGELRSRADRLARFRDVAELEAVLARLAGRDDGPFVVRLAREPGRREARFAHCFGDLPETVAQASAERDSSDVPAPRVAVAPPASSRQAFDELDAQVNALRAEVAELMAAVTRMRDALR